MLRLLIIMVMIGVLILIENIRECGRFQVTEYNVKSKKIKNDYKVVFLTDLHNKDYGNANQKLRDAIREKMPDIILIGGDMILGTDRQPIKNSYELIRDLTTYTTVYHANGNHEQRKKERVDKYGDFYVDYKKRLEDLGVIMLENQSCLIGDDLEVTGVEIPSLYYVKFSRDTLKVDELNDRIKSINPNRFQILMAHTPSYTEQYIEWGADLSLSGHYHGGMIRLPYYGGIINPQAKLFPQYTGGHYKVKGKDAIVSKGLGEHTVKVRINNIPEIVVINLQPE